jgi:hypothetical protein
MIIELNNYKHPNGLFYAHCWAWLDGDRIVLIAATKEILESILPEELKA